MDPLILIARFLAWSGFVLGVFAISCCIERLLRPLFGRLILSRPDPAHVASGQPNTQDLLPVPAEASHSQPRRQP